MLQQKRYGSEMLWKSAEIEFQVIDSATTALHSHFCGRAGFSSEQPHQTKVQLLNTPPAYRRYFGFSR
jgi:hypothetical protein